MAFEPPFEDEFFDVVCDAVLLQFDIEQASGSELVQNVGQQWYRVAESGIKLAQVFIRKIPDATRRTASRAAR